MSTAEPTHEGGASRNPRWSPCNQYVFNTAITRSRSLVVCTGNPFLLMKIEEKMENEACCWKEYIKRCMLAKTFKHCLTGIDETHEEKVRELQNVIFQENQQIGTAQIKSLTVDGILETYKQEFKKINAYKTYTLHIERNDMNEERWKISDKTDHNETTEAKKYESVLCELEIKTRREAIGYHIDGSEAPIIINGYNNRRGAFNGDIVHVEVLGSDKTTGKMHGIVRNVKERRCSEYYVCQVDAKNPVRFIPLDKTVPIFVNLPFITRMMLQQYDKDVLDDIQNQKQYIAVYKEESLSIKHQIPQIHEIIPFDLAIELLFIVKLIEWDPEFPKPLGAVIEAVPISNNFFFTKRLLQVTHNIREYNTLDMQPVPNTQQEENSYDVHEVYDQAFTIDPNSAKNLDDAISLTSNGTNSFTLAVLITHVSKHLNKQLDDNARQRGQSVYATEKEYIPMIPDEFSEQHLSLLPNKERDALAVTAKVSFDTAGKVRDVQASNKPKRTRVKSRWRLTYEGAQDSLNKINDKAIDLKGQLDLASTLYHVYHIARYLRKERLGDAGYAYQVSDAGEENNWQAHLLVEELMIWANGLIARYMCSQLPNLCILRRQLPPSDDDVKKFKEQFEALIPYSLSFTPFLTPSSPCLLLLTKRSLELIQKYSKDDKPKNQVQLQYQLFTDKFYPQLAALEKAHHNLNRSAEYITSDKELAIVSHHSLNMPLYTQFTSPIRRYCDVVVQKIVTALLQGDSSPYTIEALKELCTHLNKCCRMQKKYEHAMHCVELVKQCEQDLQKHTAFVIDASHKNQKFQLCFTSNECKYIKSENSRFHMSELNCGKGKWKVMSATFTNSQYLLDQSKIGELSEVHVPNELSQTNKIAIKLVHPNEKNYQKVTHLIAPIIPDLVEIPYQIWVKAHEYIKLPTDYNRSSLRKSILPFYEQHRDIRESRNTGSKYRKIFEESPVCMYDVNKTLSVGDMVTVWIGRSLSRPIPTPSLQLMEVAPTVQICLAHNQHPALCFSDVHLKQASKREYPSLEVYIDLWSKVLLAESAQNGVEEKVLRMLRGVTLDWGNIVPSDNCMDDIYYVPGGLVQFEISPKQLQIRNFIEIRIGDLVCARFISNDLPNAIYHFVLHKVGDDENKAIKMADKPLKVKLKAVGDFSCRISHKMKEQIQRPCDLQLIRIPESFRYINTVEPHYSKPLNCGHLSITATCCLYTHVYKLTPEIWPPQLSGQ